jgi:hypothetical protein
MAVNLFRFYTTANEVVQDVRLWPSSAKLWPTYVTLGVAALSTLLATMTLIAYLWSTKASNRWNLARTTVTVGTLLFNIVMWAIAAFSLQSTSAFDGTGSQSLWSASCDSTDQQQSIFRNVVNLNQFCLMQVPLSRE